MKFLLVEEDKKKDNYLAESPTQEVDSLGNPLTSEQVKFFSNSKVRGRNNKLLVCYHGTDADFDTFDKGKIGSGNGGACFGKGFYFTPEEDLTGHYGSKVNKYYLNITNPYEYYCVDGQYIIDMLNKSGYDYDKEFVNNYDYDELWDVDFLDDFLYHALPTHNPYEVFSDMVQRAGFDGIWADSEIVAFEPNQIKLITNTNPTSSNKLNEDIWNKAGTIYQPKQDSRYKRLIRKPINTLTQEEIKYIFTIHWCWYLANVRRFDYIEDALENTDDRFREEYFNECYEFFHSLSFPLKVYRAIRDSEHSNDEFTINGKNSSYSWSTNINIYKDATSKFRNCTKIVSCEIDSNVIDVANTINNFIFYTSSHHDRGYGEYEITLKQHFPQSALKNLHWIDKNEINEKLLSESLHKLSSNCFITSSPYDIKNLLLNKPKLYRILYDSNIDMYMIGDGNQIIHWDMIREAYKQGYYANQEEFIDELGGALDNYVETGIYGLYNDDYEIDPYLLYMVFSPDEDEFMLGEDGYDGVSRFSFGSLFFRDADQGLMDNCDLIRILQKHSWANESVKKIKRYYSSGRLYEGFLHSFDKLININVTEAEQIATKYVSTTPTYQSWIDNKGRFIDASKLGSHYNLIDEVFWQLSDRGQLQDIKPLDLDPDDYNKMTDLIGDSFTTTGWIQIGLDCKWAGIFQKPTTVQYRAIEEYLDYAQHKGIGNFSINVETGDDFAYADYDLKEVTPEYVVSRIKRYFASGKLYENRNELKENMEVDITNEVQRAVDNVMKNKSKYRNQDDLESVIYSAVANCFSGMHGVTRDTADMIADVYEKELERVGLISLTESINFGDRVKMDHYSKVNNGATGTCKSKIGKLCVVEWDDGSKSNEITSYLTKIDDEKINESNELEQRAKKHKKKSKGMGWHMAVNAGDVEKGIEVFNNSTGDLGSGDTGMSMGESIDDKLYYYDGPIYYRGHKITDVSDIYTTAKSLNVAIRNVLYKATKGDKEELYHYEIVDDMVKEVPKNETPKVRPKCPTCGYELNDIGDCPVCDYGEDDLLESLSDLEALWQLSKLD